MLLYFVILFFYDIVYVVSMCRRFEFEFGAESKSIYRFLQLLEIYPADPPGRWWFIARLRPHIELALDTQGVVPPLRAERCEATPGRSLWR